MLMPCMVEGLTTALPSSQKGCPLQRQQQATTATTAWQLTKNFSLIASRPFYVLLPMLVRMGWEADAHWRLDMWISPSPAFGFCEKPRQSDPVSLREMWLQSRYRAALLPSCLERLPHKSSCLCMVLEETIQPCNSRYSLRRI